MTRQEAMEHMRPIIDEIEEKHRFELEAKEIEIVNLRWEINALKRHIDQIWELAVNRIAEEMLKTKIAQKEPK